MSSVPSTLRSVSFFLARFLFRFSSLGPSVLTKIITDRLQAELEAKAEAKQPLPIRVSGGSAKRGATVVTDRNKTPRDILEHLGVCSAYSVAGLGSHSGQAMRLRVSPEHSVRKTKSQLGNGPHIHTQR